MFCTAWEFPFFVSHSEFIFQISIFMKSLIKILLRICFLWELKFRSKILVTLVFSIISVFFSHQSCSFPFYACDPFDRFDLPFSNRWHFMSKMLKFYVRMSVFFISWVLSWVLKFLALSHKELRLLKISSCKENKDIQLILVKVFLLIWNFEHEFRRFYE